MPEIENLLLEHMKAIRGSLARLENDMQDVKARLLTLESYQAASHVDDVRKSTRLDDLDKRLNRVETRLELRDNGSTSQ